MGATPARATATPNTQPHLHVPRGPLAYSAQRVHGAISFASDYSFRIRTEESTSTLIFDLLRVMTNM